MEPQALRVAARWQRAMEETAGRGEFFTPRNSYLPPEIRGSEPNVDSQGTDAAIWTYETNGVLYAIAFAGKQSKPLWHHRFRNDQDRQRYIDTTLEKRKYVVEHKQKKLDERKNFQHDYKEGDILYSSWGYDQTNIDWYEVTKVVGKQIEIRPIAGKQVGGGGGRGTDEVMPVPGHFTGPAVRKTPNQWGIRLTSYSSAFKWDGKPKHQTESGYGH
jgi:hypothetical protein